MRSRRPWLVAALLLALVAVGGLALFLQPQTQTADHRRPAATAPVPAPAQAARPEPPAAPVAATPVQPVALTYTGAAACAGCHAQETKAWTGSHHQLAMQKADAATVLGDFGDVTFEHRGVTSRFFRRDGRFMVRTDGPDGKLADYEVTHTFGVTPLQQYLVPFPGGRLQALPFAWDTRTKEAGGQRWFHLYPDETLKAGDPLHWAGIYQNWNLQCAECHVTNLRKGYDAAGDSYRTTFSEMNVACEACHGPGSRHVAWAKGLGGKPAPAGADNGLVVRLDSRWQDAWRFPEGDAAYARRDRPAPDAVMNTCAACHARRSTIAEGGLPGAPLETTHRPAVLTAPNYHADGQQNDEVFTWGSFRQSRMFQAGVTCMDCHEPHALTLRAEGNSLCGRCHNAAVFDTPKHHRHAVDSAGAACVSCHMPPKTYMGVDARRDHAFKVPRPDIAKAVGSPDACTSCHSGKSQDWAAAALDSWHGAGWRQRPQDALAFHAGTTHGVAALPRLLEIAGDASRPAIVRATAAELARPHLGPGALGTIASLATDPDPLLRIAAIGMSERLAPHLRVQIAGLLVQDGVRGVRTEAARVLADVPAERIPPAQRPSVESALREYVATLELNADWPASNVALGTLRTAQGRVDEARSAYEKALQRDPRFVGAYVNLADLERRQGRESEAEAVLRRGLAQVPDASDLNHALGLSLVRQGRRAEALNALAEAARLAPDNPRYPYVHAIALNSAGDRAGALAVLRDSLARHPADVDTLAALVSINREAGDTAAALVHARMLKTLLPGNREVERLVEELEARRAP